MGIICPSCDAQPSTDETAGGPCARCGSRLVVIDGNDSLIGTVVDGRFEVLGRLGQGGMGVVYRARQRSVDREIALKVLDQRVELDAASVKRFFREAKVASSLAHPNTVAIIDFGQSEDGRLYIAMELVRGRTLHDELARGQVSTARIVEIGVQLCDALEGAAPAPAQDMYAIGVILAELSVGKALWAAPTLVALFTQKLDVDEAIENVAPALRALVRSLLDPQPSLRPTATQVRATLRAIDLANAGANTVAFTPAAKTTLLPAPVQAQRRSSALGTEPTAIVAAPVTMEFPETLSLVALDGSDARPPAPAAPVIEPARAAAPLLRGTAAPDPAFVRPELPEIALMAEPKPPQRSPTRKRFQAGPLVALLLIAATAVGVGLYVRRKPRATAPATGAAAPIKKHGSVEITITAKNPTDVEVDGERVGRTPLTLSRPSSTRLLLITGGGGVEQITPDHDQTVELRAN